MAYMDEYKKWMESQALSDKERSELSGIDEKDIESRFYSALEFGTAGLRGVLGMGINRMNVYVVRQATQGFARVILDEGDNGAERGVVICHDCRNYSREFAVEAACVMAGNGIKVRLFENLRPTPELSFAIREYGAIAGINITASHNPKEYNGYKVYWEDGAQLPPKHASAVAAAIAETDIFTGITRMDYDDAVRAGIITELGRETDEKFLKKVLSQAINRDVVKKVAGDFKIVYTPFHGTGYKLVPEALKRLGIKHIIPVEEQMVIDGDFPTVVSPNPENPEGFALGIELAKKHGSDLIIGTDPDADRVGVMVRNKEGEYVTISGNQMGVLLLDYIITAKKAAGTLPKNAAALKTIVTTEMARAVCEKNGVYMEETFTGFKFMAEKIKEYETTGEHQVIFSYEESYGYMLGNYVRDKDAVTASMMIAEMAAYYFDRGMTLYDAMQELYEKYGYYSEKTLNLMMPGVDGLAKMAELMAGLRKNPPKDIAGTAVKGLRDYSDGVYYSQKGKSKLPMSGSNVLYFELQDGTSFIVRPSGTEPKVKIYILTSGKSKAECAEKVEKYSRCAEELKG